MQSDQIRRFDMLRRVRQFLDDFATKLAIVNATAARQELDALVEQMALNEAAQATSTVSARAHTATQKALREVLWIHHMRPVATIAAAHLRDVPGFAALVMPHCNVKVAVLVQEATAMADAARQHQQVFLENGRSEGFADALVIAANAVRETIDSRARSIASRAGARHGLKATASRAHLIVTLLDAQVRSVLIDDPKTLASWKSARRVGRGRVSRTAETAPAPSPAGGARVMRETEDLTHGGSMKADQTGASDRSPEPGPFEETATPSHQRASFSDPLPGGDPTAPGAPQEPGGEGFTQAPNPTTSKALRIDDSQKGTPGPRDEAGGSG